MLFLLFWIEGVTILFFTGRTVLVLLWDLLNVVCLSELLLVAVFLFILVVFLFRFRLFHSVIVCVQIGSISFRLLRICLLVFVACLLHVVIISIECRLRSLRVLLAYVLWWLNHVSIVHLVWVFIAILNLIVLIVLLGVIFVRVLLMLLSGPKVCGLHIELQFLVHILIVITSRTELIDMLLWCNVWFIWLESWTVWIHLVCSVALLIYSQ